MCVSVSSVMPDGYGGRLPGTRDKRPTSPKLLSGTTQPPGASRLRTRNKGAQGQGPSRSIREPPEKIHPRLETTAASNGPSVASHLPEASEGSQQLVSSRPGKIHQRFHNKATSNGLSLGDRGSRAASAKVGGAAATSQKVRAGPGHEGNSSEAHQ